MNIIVTITNCYYLFFVNLCFYASDYHTMSDFIGPIQIENTDSSFFSDKSLENDNRFVQADLQIYPCFSHLLLSELGHLTSPWLLSTAW